MWLSSTSMNHSSHRTTGDSSENAQHDHRRTLPRDAPLIRFHTVRWHGPANLVHDGVASGGAVSDAIRGDHW